jgi:hypothetical protein
MKLQKLMLMAVALIALGGFTQRSYAQSSDTSSYTEGPVVVVSYIRTEPGRFEEYMTYLAGNYKRTMEEQKKAGIILDYAIYSAEQRTENDPDLMLTVTYANMAALDNLNEKTRAITAKVWGSVQASTTASIDRGKLRKEAGGQTLRKLILK